MIEKKKRENPEINASSMADIAFLLLIFFLVTTTIASDKGVTIFLPPITDEPPPPLKSKNVFKVQLNSADKLRVEDKMMAPSDIKEACKEFLSNNGKDPNLSVSPKMAVVSIKADRGTSYKAYAEVYDNIKTAYYELRAEAAKVSYSEYIRVLNTKSADRTPREQKIYKKAREAYPLQISEAE